MPNYFHIGNQMSMLRVSDLAIPFFHNGNRIGTVIARIGSKHPSRLYIREWIDHRGLDQERVAERMDCSAGTVSKLIRGDMKMTTEWLALFADALDVSVPQLFNDPAAPTRDELLAIATPEEFRAAIQIIRLAKTGTGQ